MSIEIIGQIVPKNSGYFPLLNAIYLQNGYCSVATTGARDNIPSGIRGTGFLVYVQSQGITYRLASGVTNGDWQRVYDNGFNTTFGTGTSWTISHNLGYNPNIQLLDSSGNILHGQIVHNSANQSTANFNTPIAGTAYCS